MIIIYAWSPLELTIGITVTALDLRPVSYGARRCSEEMTTNECVNECRRTLIKSQCNCLPMTIFPSNVADSDYTEYADGKCIHTNVRKTTVSRHRTFGTLDHLYCVTFGLRGQPVSVSEVSAS